ncbi:muramidase [Burkholderia aenigmatica]|uniref:muramidase n=1 Tax=Burkholderia aenigmatica TaxID=2015348 RepID=UPI00264C3609|nr:muramidase [Burkholderia aenigmatica]MDN7880121.1 muramidase [Burkholderia aenigmatica]
MGAVDLPPRIHERVVCSISAATKYEIPANLLLAVAEKEAGKPGQWVRNTNGTSDVGSLQFNTAYLATLARYGITPDDVAQAGCYPYDLAAWRIRGHLLRDAGDIWTRAANYHSRTPIYNATYRADLVVRAARWADWLQARYATYDMQRPGTRPQSPIVRVSQEQRETREAGKPSASASEARAWVVQSNRSAYVPRAISVSQRGINEFK